MPLKQKINLKLYLSLTLLTTFVISLVSRITLYQFWGMAIAYLATMANHYLLYRGLEELLSIYALPDESVQGRSKLTMKILGFMLGKLLVLLGGLSLGVLFMGDKIFIAVANYIIQIFVLIFCIKKDKET